MKRYIHNTTNTYPIEVVPEADDDNGNPTCWGVKMVDSNGKNHYIWITMYEDEGNSYYYAVEDSDGRNLAKGLTYKTFGGAKKKAFEIAARQEDRDFFTD